MKEMLQRPDMPRWGTNKGLEVLSHPKMHGSSMGAGSKHCKLDTGLHRGGHALIQQLGVFADKRPQIEDPQSRQQFCMLWRKLQCLGPGKEPLGTLNFPNSNLLTLYIIRSVIPDFSVNINCRLVVLLQGMHLQNPQLHLSRMYSTTEEMEK